MTTTTRPRSEVEAEIKETLGLVPSFFERFPDETLDHEAVHLAKHTVAWSVYLNGIREDEDRFAEELGQIGAHLSS